MLIPRRNSGPKVPIIDLLYHYLLLLILTMNLEYSNLKMMCSLYRIVSPGFVLYIIKIPSRYWKERDVAKLAVWCLQIPDSVPGQFWFTDLEKFVQRFFSLDDHLDSLRINVTLTQCFIYPLSIANSYYWILLNSHCDSEKKLQEFVRKWYNIIEKLFEKKVCRYVIDVEYCLVKYLNYYEISTRFMDIKRTKSCKSHCNYQLNGSYKKSPLWPL